MEDELDCISMKRCVQFTTLGREIIGNNDMRKIVTIHFQKERISTSYPQLMIVTIEGKENNELHAKLKSGHEMYFN